MRIAEEKIEVINNWMNAKKSGVGLREEDSLRINLCDSAFRATIFKDNWAVCRVEELSQMIRELTMMKEAIEEQTGLIL